MSQELERYNPGYDCGLESKPGVGEWVKFKDASARIAELEKERDIAVEGLEQIANADSTVWMLQLHKIAEDTLARMKRE